ncbi:MAG: FUSC family protein [Proteobacteria bacterium]|uniref:FUSC family protein n=1 Tax=Rudaea sp. TaxID=2136325 RepID=UPI0032203386|nr:FUSC family protein [Pseudomonadota bacterium]
MLRTLIELKPRDVPFSVALRNTAGLVLPLGIGIATGHVTIGLGIASGALNTMFLDQPGPYRLRMQRMLLGALGAGLSGFAGSLLGANAVTMAIATLICGISGGMLVALGPNAGRAGLTCIILLLVMSADPKDFTGAASAGLLVFAGGLIEMLLALAAWPLQRYRPERSALARVYRELAAITHRPFSANRLEKPPPVTQGLLDVEQLLNGAHRARGAEMERFRVLAQIVERVRLELLAFGDAIGALPEGDARQTLLRLREYASRTLDGIGEALEHGTTAEATSGAIEGFDAALASLDGMAAYEDPLHRRTLTVVQARAQALGGQLRAAIRNAGFAGSRGEIEAEKEETRLPATLRTLSPFATLRANLHLQSVAFRHALRLGVCVCLALIGERVSGYPHGFWVPMTTAIVLKPDFAGTFSFGLLRVIGTLAGLVLTTALVHYALSNVWEQLAFLALLSVGFRILTPMNYGLGVMMLTGLIVLLLAFYGIAPGDTMLARGIATTIGCTFALVAYALWPTWEQLRPALATLIESYRAYFHSLFDGDAAGRRDARTASRSARTNAQASLDRLRGEPKPDSGLIALAESVFANANRFVRACMALEAVLQDSRERPAHTQVIAFAQRIDAALGDIADGLRHDHPAHVEGLRSCERELARTLAAVPPDDAAHAVALAIADACDRATDSVNTLAHLLDREAVAHAGRVEVG